MASKNRTYREDHADEYYHGGEKAKGKFYTRGGGGGSSGWDGHDKERDEAWEYHDRSRNAHQDNFAAREYDGRYRERGYGERHESRHGDRGDRTDRPYDKYDEDRQEYDPKRGKRKYEERRNGRVSPERGYGGRGDSEHYEKYGSNRAAGGADDGERENRKGWASHHGYGKEGYRGGYRDSYRDGYRDGYRDDHRDDHRDSYRDSYRDGHRRNEHKSFSRYRESERRGSYNNSSVEDSQSEYASGSDDGNDKYCPYGQKKYKVGENSDEQGEFTRGSYSRGGYPYGSHTHSGYTREGFTTRKINNVNDVLEMKSNIELSRFIFIYKLGENITEEEIDEMMRNTAISNAFSLPVNIYINRLSFFSVKDELFVREGLEFIKNNSYFNNIQLSILNTQMNNQINDDRCCIVEFPSNEASAKLFSLYEKNKCCIEMGKNTSYIFPLFKLKKKVNKIVEDKQAQKKFYDWYCSYCNFLNFSRRTACFFCKETKSSDAKMVESETKIPPNVFMKNGAVMGTAAVAVAPQEGGLYGAKGVFSGMPNVEQAAFVLPGSSAFLGANGLPNSEADLSQQEVNPAVAAVAAVAGGAAVAGLAATAATSATAVGGAYPVNVPPLLRGEENATDNFETSIKEILEDVEKTNMLILKDIDGSIPNKDLLKFLNEVFENRHVNYLYLFNDVRSSNKRKGFCFVEFEMPSYAEQMMSELEGNFYINYKNDFFKLDYVYEKGKEYFFHSINLAKLNINKSAATVLMKNYIPHFNFFVSYMETVVNMMSIKNYTFFLLWSSQVIILKKEKPALSEFFFDYNTHYYYHPVFQIYFDNNTNFYMSLSKGYYIWNDKIKCLVRMYMGNEQQVGADQGAGDEKALGINTSATLGTSDQEEQHREGSKEDTPRGHPLQAVDSGELTAQENDPTAGAGGLASRMGSGVPNSAADNRGGNEPMGTANPTTTAYPSGGGKVADPNLPPNEETPKNTALDKISSLVERAKMIALASKKNIEQMNMNEASSTNVEKKSKEIIKKHFATDSADEDNDDLSDKEELQKKGHHSSNAYSKGSQLNKGPSRITSTAMEGSGSYHKGSYKTKNSLIESLAKVQNRGQWAGATKEHNNNASSLSEPNRVPNLEAVKGEGTNEHSSNSGNDLNICFICLRKFANAHLLQKHVDMSSLHKRNFQLAMDVVSAG
ncbi:Ran-binding protein, putative [Plasmodium vivax]|uniref:Ran-binding protein n=3 Tax=Plasmodium vivax TaxID=5855 RepID=A5K2E3_PLAVS|nr:hypothetical protein, conserved [Plasmodium vivax]EDL46593.1 hypothetical protein, conserved [Plasmodium vivax]KMZ98937.1 hypothetical protein PVNG_00731 [Plasmodium vivax North Korean]CAG9477735.1 unnamed protein product [Plasmodium vivax]SCO73549.1 Ran-binding protein, putative [Plasmodium vivax]|eukprot:XP_001616320.1 hypothetical protein [Plasmodium vivax Sal-1]